MPGGDESDLSNAEGFGMTESANVAAMQNKRHLFWIGTLKTSLFETFSCKPVVAEDSRFVL